jgi:DMSO/TMAO reductase YedYZ molybdopterin-dependent catalytic subunit
MSAIDKHRSRYSPDVLKRLPPGQVTTAKWPVLTAGANPPIDLATWRFRLFGLVEKEWNIDWEEWKRLPRVAITTDMHCVTRWSRLGMTWGGVSIHEILKHVAIRPAARYVLAHSYGDYTTNLPLADLLDPEVLLADTADGAPLSSEHGGPMRLVVPKLYAWKSAKFLKDLEFMEKDRPGFWENFGYHNHGDPWKEERMGRD